MAARTTQPTADCTIYSAYDPKYVYVGSVGTPEFQTGAAVTYYTSGGATDSYNPVTRGGNVMHAIAGSAYGRALIASAARPAGDFIVLLVFYNESASGGTLVAAKNWFGDSYGFWVNIGTDALAVMGSSSTEQVVTATGIHTSGTTHVVAVEFSGTTAIISADGSSKGTVTGLAAQTGTWEDGLAFGNLAGTGEGNLNYSYFALGAILGSKGTKTLNELTTNPWQIFDDGVADSAATFAFTTGSPTFSFTAVGQSSDATFAVTTATPAFSMAAEGAALGTITSPTLKNNTGTVLSGLSGITVYVHNPTTGALVVKLTGQTTNGSGVLTCSDASIVAATAYRVIVVLGTGAEGMDTVTAS